MILIYPVTEITDLQLLTVAGEAEKSFDNRASEHGVRLSFFRIVLRFFSKLAAVDEVGVDEIVRFGGQLFREM